MWAEKHDVALWCWEFGGKVGYPGGARGEGAGLKAGYTNRAGFSGPMNSLVTCGTPGHRRYGGGLMAVSNSTFSPSDVPLGRGWK